MPIPLTEEYAVLRQVWQEHRAAGSTWDVFWADDRLAGYAKALASDRIRFLAQNDVLRANATTGLPERTPLPTVVELRRSNLAVM